MKYKFFFISNLVNCLIIPFFNLSFAFGMMINNVIQIGLIIYYYRFIRKKSDKRTKSILSLRISNLIIFNTIFLCDQLSVSIVILVITLLLLLNLISIIHIYYRGIVGYNDEEDEI
jgi:hypothetical protein